MSRVLDDNLVLSREESRNLIESLLMPRKEVLAKRDAFFKSIDEMEVEKRTDGTVLIEIPDLFCDELRNEENIIQNMDRDNYCFSSELFIEVNYYGDRNVQVRVDNVQYYSKSKDTNKYCDSQIEDIADAA